MNPIDFKNKRQIKHLFKLFLPYQQKMKTQYPILMLFLIILLNSCSSAKIISDVDQGTDFNLYKTYVWSAVEDPMNTDYPQFDNSLNRKRWKSAIDQAMQQQGYKAVDSKGDLEVDFHLQFEHNVVPQHNHQDEMGDQYSGIGATSVYQYDRGTVTIHLVDLKQKQIVWQGIATRVVDIGLLEKAETNIPKAVEKLFDKLEAHKKNQ